MLTRATTISVKLMAKYQEIPNRSIQYWNCR